MSNRNSALLKRHRLSAAMISVLLLPAGAAIAQDAGQSANGKDEAKTLDRVTVTGSLIPQAQIETVTPVTVITAEQIKAKGFSTVAEVLQQSSFATGAVQGAQTSAGFTQGADAVSLFGMPAGYTKYLIDGRPMVNYPALYNGSDAFNNISGIPIDMVERIEILPGGSSSLYGSDAIAGVINFILKKHMDGGVATVRGGAYTEGGGSQIRGSFAHGFSALDGRLNGIASVQIEQSNPIWGYQRDLTKEMYTEGYSAPVASRDYLVYGYKNFLTQGFSNSGYVFPAGASCANVASQFGGTEALQYRNTSTGGYYCGSYASGGYRTLKNEKKDGQFAGHVTFDLNDNTQLYADVLYSRDTVKYHSGSSYTWWGTSVKWGYYWDPEFGGLMNLQRTFSPEDMGPGGYSNTMSRDESRSYTTSLGARGTFGESKWDYDATVSRGEYKLDEHSFVSWADAINDYFESKVLGPQLGVDPAYDFYPVFSPNWGAFYSVMSPEDFASFTGYAVSRSKTWDNTARFQTTNADLFSLPGGSAGIALAAEYGQESWQYNPDPRLLDGGVWGTTAVAGSGKRDRYAVTTELRLPVLDQLTFSLSGRYDKFSPDGAKSYDKPTYNIGFEYRPFESLLLRGKYGTAFKAPTLADNFQGMSGYYSYVVDYYNCAIRGYGPENVDSCSPQYTSRQFKGTTSGSVDLKPMTADVWSYGLVWSPLAKLSVSADFLHWDIKNEVGAQDANSLTLTEMHCRLGDAGYDIASPTCQDALSKITRGSSGSISAIYTPKVNQSRRVTDSIISAANYGVDIGSYGSLGFNASYTVNLKQKYWAFDGDAAIDLLRRPGWSSDPKHREELSVNWTSPNDTWTTTLYANRIGGTPNYAARVADNYTAARTGTLPAYTYYNASVTYAPGPIELSLMVNNLTNEMPPDDHSYPGTAGAPYNSSVYSVYGRAVYFEAKYKF